MNIYKVTRKSLLDYDTYSSFVCFANNEEEAKNIKPSFVNVYDKNFSKRSLFIDWDKLDNLDTWVKRTWVQNKDDLTVIKLGTSDFSQVGVILASFHAG